ncbi:MAG: ATP-binding protein, partial [Oscillospiraceae bacterium]|nr:ATP-binding protein [Oscillospiraceae bacterium]
MNPMSDINKSLPQSTSFDVTSQILNSIDAMVYITDPKTGEILFINESMKHHYGLKDGVGEICYKVLQDGIDERCEFCACPKLDLNPDEVVIWEEHSTLTKRYYKNTDRYIDWYDGRKVHVQHSVDITDEKTLRFREEIISAKNKSSKVFYLHEGKTFDDVMTNGIKPIADVLSIDRVSIYHSDKESGLPEMIYLWSKEDGGTVSVDKRISLFSERGIMEKWIKKLHSGMFINNRVCDLPEDEASALVDSGIKWIFIAPAIMKGKLWGAVILASYSDELYYANDTPETELLLSATHIFSNAFIREKMQLKISESLHTANQTLDNMTSILNKSDVMIYVANPETDEVLFINDITREHFDIKGEVIGQPCYKVFNKGLDERCEWCPCNKLDEDPDQIIVWEEHNSVTGRFYRNIDRYVDWFGGKKVHIQYRTDLTDMIDRQTMLMRSQKLTAVLNSTALIFLSFKKESLKDMMTSGIKLIADAVDVDMMTVFRNRQTPDGLKAEQVYKWESEKGGTTAFTDDESDYSVNEKYSPDWERLLVGDFNTNGPSQKLSRGEKANPKDFGILSVLVAPVVINDVLWGCVIYADCRKERTFDNDSASMMRSGAFLCANAIIRKELEQSLSDAEERIKLMLDSTPLCCMLFDSNHVKIDCNQETIRLFGFIDKQEFLQQYTELYPEYQPCGRLSSELVEDNLKEAFKTGRCSFNWTYKMLDGELMPAEVVLVRVKYGNDYVVAAYSRDLREYKKMMEVIEHRDKLLIEQNAMLIESHEQTKKSLARERDLEIQKQVAEAASETKTQFLANMSHEIRTPMNAIIGMSDLLLSESLSKHQRRYAEDIRLSGLALLDIINDILDLSKIQTTKLKLTLVHYDFRLLIDHVSSMVQFLINDTGKNIKFKTFVEDGVPECLYGDDVRFRQVLLNLLGNAVKYTKKGRITLTMGVRDSDLNISVTDTGIGIREESLPLLFEAFERVDTHVNRQQEGTGLGLTITKSLVELMGGNISVDSVYGVGTSLNITIPFVEGDIRQIKQENMDSDIIQAPDVKVLVVDDRETNLNVISGLLRQCRIVADKAISGENAIEMVKQKQYDMIFMDHMMPEMDGVETTDILRKTGFTAPIVALTANAVSGARELLISSGMDDFLSKPIIKPELYRVLRTYLPKEKVDLNPDIPEKDIDDISDLSDNEKFFWERISTVKCLTAETGLSVASGQIDVYRNTLEIFLREIQRSIKSLPKLLVINELRRFCTEVHGIKGSLSLIGANELSSEALKLEKASRAENFEFCKNKLDEFIRGLTSLCAELNTVFEDLREREKVERAGDDKNSPKQEIPPELPPILKSISDAMVNTDYLELFESLDLLAQVECTGIIADAIVNLTEAAQIMNYDYAQEI